MTREQLDADISAFRSEMGRLRLLVWLVALFWMAGSIFGLIWAQDNEQLYAFALGILVGLGLIMAMFTVTELIFRRLCRSPIICKGCDQHLWGSRIRHLIDTGDCPICGHHFLESQQGDEA